MAQEEREEMPTIVPMIAYEDAATAIDWLVRAFGFRERKGERMKDRDGRVTHAELRLGESRVFLATPTPDYQGPKHHRRRARPPASGPPSRGSSTGCSSTWTMSIDTSVAPKARVRPCFRISRTNRTGGCTVPKIWKGIAGCFSSRLRDRVTPSSSD